MPGRLLFIFCISILAGSCAKKSGGGLFSKKNAREKYEEQIKSAPAALNPAAAAWITAGNEALRHPVGIPENYAEAGRFAKENQFASAFVVSLRREQKLLVNLDKTDNSLAKIYLDMWLAGDSLTGRSPEYIGIADTLSYALTRVADKDEKVVVRVQQEIAVPGSYSVQFQTGPSLFFPIPSNVKSSIGSFWGDGRDGGSRKHEGIDIFAPKHSPAIAVADGVVTSVSESELGGKYVFFSPNETNYNVYYAHLDSQMVRPGQRLRTGEVLGLTGNTGNAKYTASHLHFGIYTGSGAIDPLLFVKQVKLPEPKLLPLPVVTSYSITKSTKMYPDLSAQTRFITLNKGDLFRVLAQSPGFYRIILTDGRTGFVPLSIAKKPA